VGKERCENSKTQRFRRGEGVREDDRKHKKGDGLKQNKQKAIRGENRGKEKIEKKNGGWWVLTIRKEKEVNRQRDIWGKGSESAEIQGGSLLSGRSCDQRLRIQEGGKLKGGKGC